MSTVEIRNLHKSFGQTKVIHGIDMDIATGELVVVVGPSGCGKSTLLRMIAGLEDVSDGEISIGGQLVNGLEPRERNVAMVFQNYALYPHMTVFQNMGYALRVARRPKAEIRERVEEVAKILELELLLERKPSQLSGGQRQRVAMGRAIIRKPTVFLFDEPLSNLDAKLRTQMRVEIKKLQRRLGVTSVFVTHDQVEAMTMADRLVVMNDGKIEQIGTSAEVYARPATAYVGSFIGSPPMNFFEGRLDADGGELALANGSTFTLGAGNRGPDNPRDVTVGIRPEHLHIVVNGDHTISGRVDLVEELGAARLLHVQGSGASFIVQVPPSEAIAIGGDVSLGVAVENLHVFDAKEGRRID